MGRGRRVGVVVALAAVTALGLGLTGCGPASKSASGPGADPTPSSDGIRVLEPAATLKPQVTPTAGGSTDAPVAGAARDGAGNGGAAVRPERLVLPSGKSADVDPAGIRNDGSLVVPDLPSRVGWWTGGAEAGDPYGSVVLAGHVDSRVYGLGALAELAKVKVGDVLAVAGTGADGTGRTLRYRVDGVHEVKQADLVARAAPFAQDMPARLVLITCGGPFDTTTHHYRDNVVVTAAPVP